MNIQAQITTQRENIADLVKIQVSIATLQKNIAGFREYSSADRIHMKESSRSPIMILR